MSEHLRFLRECEAAGRVSWLDEVEHQPINNGVGVEIRLFWMGRETFQVSYLRISGN